MNSKTISRRHFLRNSSVGLGILPGLSIGCGLFRKKPNIIFLLTDDQRWDALGYMGNPIIKTPNMDFLAKNGTTFNNAFVTTPICAASRASLFTGLYERTHGYTFTKPPIDKKFTDLSYPKLLKENGYRTGFVGKFGVKVPEGITEEWFDYFKPTSYPYFKNNIGREKHLTDINFNYAIDFIRSSDQNQPFCLSISTWAPHADDGAEEQYFWPKSCDNLYQDETIPEPKLSNPEYFESLPEFIKKSFNRTRWFWRFDTPEKYQKMVKGYYRMISGIDRALGRLLDQLKKNNLDQNTIIIFTSDNGYFLGERGFAGKWTMHDTSIKVPLIIYDPRVSNNRQGKTIEEMVLNIDITPTILELAGIPVPKEYQGQSLLPLTKNKNVSWRSEILTEHLWDFEHIPKTEGVRTDRWKYIRYQNHPEYEELYDMSADPSEKNNLAKDDNFNNQLGKMRKMCNQKIESLQN